MQTQGVDLSLAASKQNTEQKNAAVEPEERWIPTSAGSTTAYAPEWREKGGEWERVKTRRVNAGQPGVPPPLYNAGVLDAIGLMGYAQAMALAWEFAALAESMGREVEVHAAEYELRYDIKARKRATDSIPVVSRDEATVK